MGLGQAEQHCTCTFCVYVSSCLYFTVHSYCLNLAFSISTPVNGGMNDWFIRAQILKQDIADITEDYTDSIVFLNFVCTFNASSRIMEQAGHMLCFIQLHYSTIDCSLGSVQSCGLCQVVNAADYVRKRQGVIFLATSSGRACIFPVKKMIQFQVQNKWDTNCKIQLI